jgi:hypothetical protein
VSRVLDILARTPAIDIVGRHKKHADRELYAVLASGLEIVEIVEADPVEAAVLDDLVKQRFKGDNKRRYVNRGSDVYQRVCRLLFHGEEHTANVNRYAICLRQAHDHGVRSVGLVGELLTKGGVNRFYLTRPHLTDRISTRCIRLDRAVEHAKDGEIVLKLRRLPDNTYEVLECEAMQRPKPHQAGPPL